MTPTVSVVIPARNAERTLGACLDALRREGIPGANAELIVVDDGSTDRTGRLAAAYGATIVEGGGRGPAAARNLGAQRSQAEIVVYLDADTEPESGWLSALLAPLGESKVDAVKGRYVSRQRGFVPRFQQLEFEEKYSRLRAADAVDFIDTGNVAFRRTSLLRVGGFDESFPAQSAEDVELGFRLAARGGRFAFADDARVCHDHEERLASFLWKKARYGYFRAAIYRRYPTKVTGDSYTPPWMALQIACAALAPLLALSALAWRPLLAAAAVATLLFAVTCTPLLRRAWLHDRGLLPVIVPLAYLRALAQAFGLLAGGLALLARLHRQSRTAGGILV